jgi:hypothetical protein
MTLRDQLDQIARLEEKISDTGLPIDERITASNEFRQALVNWYRSGGRELAEDGMRYRWLRSEEVCTEPRYYEFWNRFLKAKLVREEVMDKLIDEYRSGK